MELTAFAAWLMAKSGAQVALMAPTEVLAEQHYRSLSALLDAAGIECSTGSACTAGVAEPSHVLLAVGADEAAARSSLRLSLGYTSTEADVDAAIAALGPAAERARVAGLGLTRAGAGAS